MAPSRLPLASRRAQSGVVLFIALIVMVALSIAGIALVRSVDTGLSITGNLGFRQASIPPSTWAVENAISAMFEKKTIADLEKDKTDQNYYAYRFEVKNNLKPEDKGGVPYDLQGATPSNYPSTFVKENDAAGNTIRYVIERMCLDAGPATAANCDMSPPKKSEATTAMELVKPELIRVPFYRITVRVDGPNNTTTFAQAMLR
jgi:type IV pilus assembly protein PilX